MKIKLFIIVLVAMFNFNCFTPAYLPASKEIDVNQFGSYIKLIHKNKTWITGELIAIDSNKMVVLNQIEKKCVTVPLTDVKRFKLSYAKPKNYGWSIPIGILLPFIHGFYSLFTLPIHLIVTITATATGENDFKYSNKNMTYDKLRMFARFPQGIPPNIDLANIK